MNKPSQYIFLPTENASEIFLHKGGDMCFNKSGVREKTEFIIPQRIYILSDDDIMHGDYFYSPLLNKIMISAMDNYKADGCKKVIATTNPDFWNTITELGKMKDGTTAYNSKRNVAMISHSDIEYIIKLENSKSKSVSVDVEKLADEMFPFAEKIGGETYAAKKGFIAGFKYCQFTQSNPCGLSLDDIIKCLESQYITKGENPRYNEAVKVCITAIESLASKSKSEIKFGSPNWKMIVDFYMYLAENDRLKPRISKFNNEDVDAFIKSISKEHPKNDTVNVEYENVNAGWQQLANNRKQGSTVVADKYAPKIDGSGNIIINRY